MSEMYCKREQAILKFMSSAPYNYHIVLIMSMLSNASIVVQTSECSVLFELNFDTCTPCIVSIAYMKSMHINLCI